MSRRGWALPLTLLLLIRTNPAFGQAAVATDRKVEAMIARAREAYSVPDDRRRCAAATSDEIVVCAPDHGERWRVPPTSETDPGSHQALRDGLPRAPNLEPHYPGIVIARGCFIPPCPPPPAYMIDLSTIPEAPAGSDADKIARGEMRAP